VVSRFGRVTVLALAVGGTVASAAEITRLVKVRVTVAGGVQSFLHEVEVANRGDPRRVSSVVLWQDIWLPAEPKGVRPPLGWSVRTLPRDGPGGTGWAVQFDCIPERTSGSATTKPDDAEVPCGLRTGESVKFRVMLPYQADYLRRQPVLVGFSDGRLALAR
jgi:hypothetical protein